MNDESPDPFRPSLLTPLQRYKMLQHYRQVKRDMDVKIQQLTDGRHTIMCENTLDNLRGIRDIYSNRIEALVNFTEESKARND